MRKIIAMSMFLFSLGSVFAQMKEYALSDSLAATKENVVGLKYLASYYPMLDTIQRSIKPLLKQLEMLGNRRALMQADFEKSYTAVDSLRKLKGKSAQAAEKEASTRLEDIKEIDKGIIKELDSIEVVVQDQENIIVGISNLAEMRVRHLVGPQKYKEVLRSMEQDGVFTYKGKIIFPKRFLPPPGE